MTIAETIRAKLAELAPRTVRARRPGTYQAKRDPATRVPAGDRRAPLPAAADVLTMRPSFLASLWRRRWTSRNKKTRKKIPAVVHVPAGAIVHTRYRAPRWWCPGLLVIQAAPTCGDPWRWTSRDTTWRLRGWWSAGTARKVWLLHERLAWLERANQLAQQSTIDRANTTAARRR